MLFAVTSASSSMRCTSKVVTLHAKIKCASGPVYDDDGKSYTKIYDTTPGRVILLTTALPKQAAMTFDVINKLMTKKEIQGMIDAVYRNCGQKDDGDLLRPHHGAGLHPRLQGRHFLRQGRHGHSAGEQAGRSSTRPAKLAKEYEQQYQDGLITQGEKYNKVVDAWSRAPTRSPRR